MEKDLGSACYSLSELGRDQVLVAASVNQLNLVDIRTNHIVKAIDQENKSECNYVIIINN